MGIKLSLVETVQPTDKEVKIGDIRFIMDPQVVHHFKNKTLAYIKDKYGFGVFSMQ